MTFTNWIRALVLAGLVMALGATGFGQQVVPPEHRYERLLMVVPMTGTGTRQDPIRPLYTPSPKEFPESGLLSVSYEMSDDGKTALVELVAPDRKAFATILKDKDYRNDIKVFEKGRVSKAEIEQEFKKYKKDFDVEKFARGK